MQPRGLETSLNLQVLLYLSPHDMRNKWIEVGCMERLVIILVLVFLLGCVSPPSSPSSTTAPTNTDNLPFDDFVKTIDFEVPTGTPDAMTICDAPAEVDRMNCFSTAVRSCARASSFFWSTPDGYALGFETWGSDAETDYCTVRLFVADTDSQYFGQSSTCLLQKSGSGDTAYYDWSAASPASCSGSYTQDWVKSPAVNPAA